MPKNLQDLIVIGGGTSGIIVAIGAVKLGLKVTLINKQSDFNGSSLISETVPKRALLQCAEIAHTIQNSQNYGIDTCMLPINMPKIYSYVQNMQHSINKNDEIAKFVSLGGKLIKGTATLIDSHSVKANNIKLRSKYLVIATGSRSALLDSPGIQPFLAKSYQEILKQQNLPHHLIIIGDQAENLELAQAFALLGSKVTVITSHEDILHEYDPELTLQLRTQLQEIGIEYYTGTTIQQIYEQNKRKVLICLDKKGNKFAIDGCEIIANHSRQTNIEELGLEAANIHYFLDGILVDHKLRTTQKHIFALGSVINSPNRSVQTAEHQANVVISNIAFKVPKKVNYSSIPQALFTNPQLVQIGMSAKQAKSKKIKELNILYFDLSKLDGATFNQPKGMFKLICSNNKLLGATILAPFATDLIGELSLAIRVGASISDIANNVHAYLTLSQANRKAANSKYSMFTQRNQNIIKTIKTIT